MAKSYPDLNVTYTSRTPSDDDIFVYRQVRIDHDLHFQDVCLVAGTVIPMLVLDRHNKVIQWNGQEARFNSIKCSPSKVL